MNIENGFNALMTSHGSYDLVTSEDENEIERQEILDLFYAIWNNRF